MCDDNKNKALFKIFSRLRPDPNDPSVRIIQRYKGNTSKDSTIQKKKKSKSSRRKDDSDSSVQFPRAQITKSNRTLRSSLPTKPETSTSSQIANINEEHSYCKTSSKREEDSEAFISKYETDTEDEAEEIQQQQEPKIKKINLNIHENELNIKTDTNTQFATDPGSRNSDSVNEPFSTLETVHQNQPEKKKAFNSEYNDSYVDEFDLTMFGNLSVENDSKDNFGAELADETYMPIIDVPHNSNPLDQTKLMRNSMTQGVPFNASFTSTPSTTKDPLLTQTAVNVTPLSDPSPSALGPDSSPVYQFTAVSPPQQPTILPITIQPKADRLPLTRIASEAPETSTSSTTLQSVQCNTFPLTTEILPSFPSERESINPQILHNNALRRDEGNFPEVDMCLSNVIKTIALKSEARPSATVQPIDWVNTQHHAPSTSTTPAESSEVTSFQTNTSKAMMLYTANSEGKKQVPSNLPNTPNTPANIVETPNLQNLNNPEGWTSLLSYLTDSEQNTKNMSSDDINEVVPLEDIKPTLYELQNYSNSIQTDASTAKPSEPMNTESPSLNPMSFRILYESSSGPISVSDLNIYPSSAVSWSEMSQHSTGTNYENYNSTSTSNFSTSGGAIELISSITAPKQPTPKNRYPGMSIAKRGSNSSIRSLSPKIESIKYLSDEEQNCRIHLVETPPPFSQGPPQIQSSYIRDYRHPNDGRAAVHLLNLELQSAQNFGAQHSEYSRPAASSSQQKILSAQIYGTTSSYDNSSSIRSFNQKMQIDNVIESFKPRDQHLAEKPNYSRLIPFQHQQLQQPAQNFTPSPDIPIFFPESQGDQTFRNPPSHYSKLAPQSFLQNLQLFQAHKIPQDIRSATTLMQEPQPAQNYVAPQETTFPPETQLTHNSQPCNAVPTTSAIDETRSGQSFGALQSCNDKPRSLETPFPPETQPPYTFVPSQPSTTSATDGAHIGQTIRAFQLCDGGTPQSSQTLGNQPSCQIRIATSFTSEPQPDHTFMPPQSYHTKSSNSSETDVLHPVPTIGTYHSCDGDTPQSNQILGNQQSHQFRIATQLTAQAYYTRPSTSSTTTNPHARQTFGTPLTSDRGPTPETIIQELQATQAVFGPQAFNQMQNFITPQLYDNRSRPLTITRGPQSAPSFVAPQSCNSRPTDTSITETGQSFGTRQSIDVTSRPRTIARESQSQTKELPQSHGTKPKRACRKTSEKKSFNSRVKHDPRHGQERTSGISHRHSTRPDLNRPQNPQFLNASRLLYMMERNTRVSDFRLHQWMEPNFTMRNQIPCPPRDGNCYGYSCQYTQNPQAPIYSQQMQPTSRNTHQAPIDNLSSVHQSANIPTNHPIDASDPSPGNQY